MDSRPLSGQVGLDSVVAAIRGKFHGQAAQGNADAATAAYAYVKAQLREPADA